MSLGDKINVLVESIFTPKRTFEKNKLFSPGNLYHHLSLEGPL